MFCVEKTQDSEMNIPVTISKKYCVKMKNRKLEMCFFNFCCHLTAVLWPPLSLCNHPLSFALKHHDSVAVNSDLAED